MGLNAVRPETVKIELAGGDWIVVKKRLNAGEARLVQTRMIKTMEAGKPIELEPMQVGRSQAMEYIVDWSSRDYPIRDVLPDAKADAVGRSLDGMDLADFKQIIDAVSAHETAMDAERVQEKNDLDGASASSATSPSAA
jgi:hypothetical protein